MKGRKKRKHNKVTHRKNKYKPTKHREFNFSNEFIGFGLIMLLGTIIYSNSFGCSFHLDDLNNIVENSVIRSLDIKALWAHSKTRFVAFYTLALNYHFGELNVWGYHFGNLLIHLINGCLIYWLTILIFSTPVLKNLEISKDKKFLALFTGLLFISHPLATNSVTYIVQRMASLVALFYLLAISLYVYARITEQSKISRYLLFSGALVSAVLAMLTKQNAFTLPFAILLFEIFFLNPQKLKVNFKNYRMIMIVALLVGFILFVTSQFSLSIFDPITPEGSNARSMTAFNYLLTQFSVIVKYFQLLIIPVNLNIDYNYPISSSLFEIRTFMSFIFLLSLVALAVFLFKRNRIISFGIFWFFLTISIESSFIPITDVIFEHRTYLPSFGFFIIMSSCIYIFLWKKNRAVATSLFLLIIGINSILTFERNKTWIDELTLWSDTISKSPDNARAYLNRGVANANAQLNNLAITDYNKALELEPEYAKAYYNRGNAFVRDKKNQLAMNDFLKSIELEPSNPNVYNNIGNIFKSESKYDSALQYYSKAIEQDQNYFLGYNNRGTVYVAQQKFTEAINDFDKAISLNIKFAEAYANRGVAKLNLGNKIDSCLDFQRAMDLGFTPVENVYNQNCR